MVIKRGFRCRKLFRSFDHHRNKFVFAEFGIVPDLVFDRYCIAVVLLFTILHSTGFFALQLPLFVVAGGTRQLKTFGQIKVYGVIVQEFGEELAPDVMDFCMDYLMGMAA